ncbi:recombinase family protein [Caulobacter sp. CCG-8]|uniref:recombinase family protein n=1 Tax=Caulobacter sp. CCG-8 TaxID=3127958 RepID=UPI00307D38A6
MNGADDLTIGSDIAAPRVRAAQYVRMSTDHQRYSTENQAAAIKAYADKHRMEIVRTYADEGKSGLTIEGRDQLRALIDDVRGHRADFEVLLVYDVSRWGRFQDADESAYLEYTCRRGGVRVVYCVEQFENDGSPTATIIKSVKRAMAGEYSRELSAKVFIGQCRLIELGFRQGGAAGYGLRRQLIDGSGLRKALLDRGEHKSLQTDRVILVPGPEGELATVRRIYQLFCITGMTERAIAELLNSEGRITDMGRPWTRGVVHQILTNEKYIGNNVFNRVSFKLKQKRVRNPPDNWIRADGVYEPIVDRRLFDSARDIIADRSRAYDDDEMLACLRQLLDDVGMLSGLVIDEQDKMPSSSAYRARFGSLLRAYMLVGYRPDRDYQYVAINRALRQLHPGIVAGIVSGVSSAGGSIHVDPVSGLLLVNGEFTASVLIVRCLQTPGGAYRWKLRFETGLEPDITIAVRMDAANRAPLDYYLFPAIDVLSDRLRLREENGFSLDAYRFDDLGIFNNLAARVPVERAA